MQCVAGLVSLARARSREAVRVGEAQHRRPLCEAEAQPLLKAKPLVPTQMRSVTWLAIRSFGRLDVLV